jgi:hypothetical protein
VLLADKLHQCIQPALDVIQPRFNIRAISIRPIVASRGAIIPRRRTSIAATSSVVARQWAKAAAAKTTAAHHAIATKGSISFISLPGKTTPAALAIPSRHGRWTAPLKSLWTTAPIIPGESRRTTATKIARAGTGITIAGHPSGTTVSIAGHGIGTRPMSSVALVFFLAVLVMFVMAFFAVLAGGRH